MIGNIAYTKQSTAHTALLGGDQVYQPLHSASFSSADRRPIIDAAYNPGGYHDRQGLPTTATNSSRNKPAMFFPNSTWTWSFIVVLFCQAVIALALEAYVFARFETALQGEAQKGTPTVARTIPTYLALFIFGFVYQLGLTWDALRHRNTIQVIGLVMYNYGLMVYAAVEVGQVNDAVNALLARNEINDKNWWDKLRPFLVATPCIIALGSIISSFVAWKLYQEFAWDIYKSISADLRMRRRFLTYQIYVALLKFDFFVFLGFTVQFLVIIGTSFTDAEFYLTIAAIPITIALLFLASLFTRHESMLGQVFIICIYFAAMAYFIFKLVRMYDINHINKVNEYLPARKSLTTFAIITILLLVATIVTAFMCMRNFNKGLKPYILKNKKQPDYDSKADNYGHEAYGQQLDPVPNRMTID